MMKNPPTPPTPATEPTTITPDTKGTPSATDGQGATMWIYKQINKSRILGKAVIAAARNAIYGLRPMLNLVIGVTAAEIQAAGALFTQATETRFDALETVKAEAPDLVPSSTMDSAEIRARREDLDGVETVEAGLVAVLKDTTGTRMLRNKELVSDYDLAKADLDARRALTEASGNPDQRVIQFSDIMNNAFQVAVDRAKQGKKDKQGYLLQGGDQQIALEKQLAEANQMIMTLREELVQKQKDQLLAGGPVVAKPPAKHTKKGAGTPPPSGRRGQKR